MPDWEWWIMDNSTDPESLDCSRRCAQDPRVIRELTPLSGEERSRLNPMAVLLNRYYGRANGDIIMYLSDDDLFLPHALRLVTDYLDAHPDHDVCWFTLQTVAVEGPGDCGPWPMASGIAAVQQRGKGTGLSVDNQVDGGQIAHRTSCLRAILPPWFPEESAHLIAAHCDGVFMEKLAVNCTFYPCGDPEVPAVVHRYTPLHTWHPPAEMPLTICYR